jgi:hypothetical protein
VQNLALIRIDDEARPLSLSVDAYRDDLISATAERPDEAIASSRENSRNSPARGVGRLLLHRPVEPIAEGTEKELRLRGGRCDENRGCDRRSRAGNPQPSICLESRWLCHWLKSLLALCRNMRISEH